MDSETLKKILHLIRYTPSGDNCQPWQFSWDDPRLKISHDKTLAHHELNRNYISSAIAFGGLYTYLEIAAPNFGYYPRLIDKMLTSSGELTLVIEFDKTEPIKSELFDFLVSRHTDRRVYHSQPIDFEILTKVTALNNSSLAASVTPGPVPEKGPAFNYLARSEKYLWSALPKAVEDLLSWIHFSFKDAWREKRGMHWAGLAAPLPAVFTLWLMKRFKFVQNIVRPIFALAAPFISGAQLKSSGAILIFTAEDPTLEAAFDAGKISIRSWLILESNGISVQPLSLASLPIQDTKLDSTFLENDAAAQEHYKAATHILQAHFKFPESHTPIWMLRIGKTKKKYPDRMRTFRCETDNLLEII